MTPFNNINSQRQPEQPGIGDPVNVADALGQIVWLLSQSSVHRELPIKALDWSFMPAIALEQFRIFRLGPTPALRESATAALIPFGLSKDILETLPLGVAIWAKLSAEAEQRLDAGDKLSQEDWKSGTNLWLLELISPFATPENRLAELMLADLVAGPFAGQKVNLHRTDPVTGVRVKVGFDAGGASQS